MPPSNVEKTREFQQKMRTQGAAGFGAGPWSEIEESLGMDQSVVVDQEGNPVWSVKHTRKPRRTTSHSAFDRLLGGVAVLASATLVTSVLAIYYEQTRESGSSQLARSDVGAGRNDDSTIMLPHLPATGFIDRSAVEVVARPDDRQDRPEPLDTGASEAGTDPQPVMAAADAGQDLPSTESAGDVLPGEPATGSVETPPTQALLDTKQHTSTAYTPVADTGYPAITDSAGSGQDLPATEPAKAPPALALLDTNEVTVTADTPSADTGNPAVQDSADSSQDIPAPEPAADAAGAITAPAQADTRESHPDVDTPATNTLAAVSPDTVEAIETITRRESPAAIGMTARPEVTETKPPALTAGKATGSAPAGTQEPAMTVDIRIAVGQPVSPDTEVTITTSPPVSTVAQVETATIQETGTVASPASESAAHAVAEVPESGAAATAPSTGTASPEDTQDTGTMQLAQLEPAAPATPSPARVAATGPAKPVAPVTNDVPQPGMTGRWIINLASYSGPKTADRMQRKFEDLGVSTDRQVAEVNGKTMYRLRIASFKSRRDAEAYFDSIKETLDLQSAWITKQ